MSREYITAVLAVVSLLAVMPAWAQSDVEKRLDNLERRVQALENASQQTKPAPAPTLSAWRQLSKHMSRDQVRALLGEPERIDAGPFFDNWQWKSGGSATFSDQGLIGWSEPR
jgi:outer membrane protein assembly factor BamE (lipoprotein component of BamABCDE complex)